MKMKCKSAVYAMVLASSTCVLAQKPVTSLPDEIDTSRTIIAKLDRAAQNDPPPNFASSILVRVHKEATTFLQTADSTSTLIRNGAEPDASTMFSLYSQYINLYDQYEMFVDVSSTTSPARKSDLATVMSTAMGKEFFETKTYLELATTLRIAELDAASNACHPPKAR